MKMQRFKQALMVSAFALSASACGTAGQLGNILGSVLGGQAGGQGQGQQGQVNGTIQNVDTRNQQVVLRQPDGSTVAISYDNRTQVTYQNQSYAVTALERGDEVSARLQNTGNSYYTDLIQVNRSVSNNTSGGGGDYSGQVNTFQGTVRQVDTSNGLFTLSTNNGTVTVSMPYNPRSTDISRFRNLRSGDYVTLQGTMLNNSRVELRQFTN